MLEIELRTLGRSTVDVPRIALGCGSFGGIGTEPAFFGDGLDDAESFAVMDAAWRLGITHFDTADAYGGGRSEELIGQWARSRDVRPLLTTKTYHQMSEGADYGLAPIRIRRQLESSLARLQVDHVDLYLAHAYDPDVSLAETLSAFEGLTVEGAVRAYGVSNFDAHQLEVALIAGSPQAVQNSYSLLDRRDEDDVQPICAQHSLAYLAFSPLSGGWLTGKYHRGETFPTGSRMTQLPELYRRLLNEPTFIALDRLAAIAQDRNMSMASLALSWLLADQRVTQVVVGPRQPAHLEPIREAVSNPLSATERDELAAVFTPTDHR
jgi:aryl-alcohol dehydrogenase-like predicted oxidoreductase